MTSIIAYPIEAAWPRHQDRALQVRGAPNIQPMLELAAENFMAERPDAAIIISAGNSIRGYKGVIDGTCDIGMIATSITRELSKTAEDKGVVLVQTAIAVDGVVPIVHPSNPVRDLSIAKLRGIFSGHITNWKQLGGPALDILPVSQPPSLGSYEVFTAAVMEDTVFTAKAPVVEGMAVLRKVAVTPAAIGYVASGYLDNHVATIRVGGIALSDENLRRGLYPMARKLILIMRQGGHPRAAEFIAYVATGDKGQRHAAKAGAIALQ